MPAASAACGSSDVSVMPGIALASSTVSSPRRVVEHEVDAREAAAAEHVARPRSASSCARSVTSSGSSAGQTNSVRPIS